MVDLDKYLIPTETPIVVTRRHWASLIKMGAASAAGLVLGLLFLSYGGASQPVAVFAVVLILASVAVFAWNVGGWYSEELIITDRRVLLVYGILTRRVGVMPLSKVTDLTYERSLVGRILGYGAFVVESAGQHQAFSRIEFLPTPDQLYHDVSLLLFPERQPRYVNRPDHPTTPFLRD